VEITVIVETENVVLATARPTRSRSMKSLFALTGATVGVHESVVVIFVDLETVERIVMKDVTASPAVLVTVFGVVVVVAKLVVVI
jgi:hypothetical protein